MTDIQAIRYFLDNPKKAYEEMTENLEFRKFVKENENKSIREKAYEYNLDFILKSGYV